MWDTVEPTKDWIYGQIPSLVRQIYEEPLDKVANALPERFSEIDFSLVSNVYVFILGGALLSQGLRFVGSGDTALRDIMIDLIFQLR
jgi:anaphase-promoting complex subunit 1